MQNSLSLSRLCVAIALYSLFTDSLFLSKHLGLRLSCVATGNIASQATGR